MGRLYKTDTRAPAPTQELKKDVDFEPKKVTSRSSIDFAALAIQESNEIQIGSYIKSSGSCFTNCMSQSGYPQLPLYAISEQAPHEVHEPYTSRGAAQSAHPF